VSVVEEACDVGDGDVNALYLPLSLKVAVERAEF
jgi:hypothetical protein